MESTGDGGVDKRGACHSTFVNCYRRRRRVDAKSSGCLSIRPPTARRAAPGRAGPCRVTPGGRRSAGDLLPGVTAASGGRSPATSVLLSTPPSPVLSNKALVDIELRSVNYTRGEMTSLWSLNDRHFVCIACYVVRKVRITYPLALNKPIPCLACVLSTTLLA